MTHAVIDPVSAWDEALTLNGYDDGNTKTNTLYWLATRPGAEDIAGGGGGTVEGCTDPGASNFNPTANVDDGTCLFPVTLSVNMNDPGAPDGAVFLAGTFNGWVAINPLSDPEVDGVWTIKMDWPLGIQEYKFTIFDWADQETFAGGEFHVDHRRIREPGGDSRRSDDAPGGLLGKLREWPGCPVDPDEDGICDTVDPVWGYDACGVCNGPGEVYDCGCSGILRGIAIATGTNWMCWAFAEAGAPPIWMAMAFATTWIRVSAPRMPSGCAMAIARATPTAMASAMSMMCQGAPMLARRTTRRWPPWTTAVVCTG